MLFLGNTFSIRNLKPIKATMGRPFSEASQRNRPLGPAINKRVCFSEIKKNYFLLFPGTFQLWSCSQDDNYAGIPSRNILGGEKAVTEGVLLYVNTCEEMTRLYVSELLLSSAVYDQNRS